MYARKIVSYMKELKGAGVPDQQASIHAEKLAEFMENNLATKEDLKNTEQRLDAKIGGVEHRLDGKIENVRTELSARIGSVESKLDWLIRLIGVVAFMFAAINFFHLYFPVK